MFVASVRVNMDCSMLIIVATSCMNQNKFANKDYGISATTSYRMWSLY